VIMTSWVCLGLLPAFKLVSPCFLNCIAVCACRTLVRTASWGCLICLKCVRSASGSLAGPNAVNAVLCCSAVVAIVSVCVQDRCVYGKLGLSGRARCDNLTTYAIAGVWFCMTSPSLMTRVPSASCFCACSLFNSQVEDPSQT
jgi:hypothetical protein